MERNKIHPLQQITDYHSLSMLESLIPFVDSSLKLPLALFIKIYEIKLIVQTFQDPDSIQRLGLHNTASKPSDILGALTGISPELLDLILSSINSENTPGNLSNLFSSFSGDPQASYEEADFKQTINPFLSSFITQKVTNTQSIDDLFAAYDQEQLNSNTS